MKAKGIVDYHLPEDKIAQRPIGISSARSDAKLLHLNSSGISDQIFSDLPQILLPGDLLILNNTRVIPARFFPEIKGRTLEIVLLKRRKLAVVREQAKEIQEWEVLARPMRRFLVGAAFSLSEHLSAVVCGRTAEGDRLVLQINTKQDSSLNDQLEPEQRTIDYYLLKEGLMPIPPYIRKGYSDFSDREFYQTVFAANSGSIAAPTAGLHFTKDLIEQLIVRGVEIAYLTLHVGPASFAPIRVENVLNHKMDTESYSIPEQTREAIKTAKASSRRVVAVGTTSVRALESYASVGGFDEKTAIELQKDSSDQCLSSCLSSSLFINPGFQFRVVDALITNFHQPRTTHLLLVAAFIGEEALKQAYCHALASDYRFLSYGDAMFVEPGR